MRGSAVGDFRGSLSACGAASPFALLCADSRRLAINALLISFFPILPYSFGAFIFSPLFQLIPFGLEIKKRYAPAAGCLHQVDRDIDNLARAGNSHEEGDKAFPLGVARMECPS